MSPHILLARLTIAFRAYGCILAVFCCYVKITFLSVSSHNIHTIKYCCIYLKLLRPSLSKLAQQLLIFSAGGMDHVRIHPRFLHSNATSHKWVLGGKVSQHINILSLSVFLHFILLNAFYLVYLLLQLLQNFWTILWMRYSFSLCFLILHKAHVLRIQFPHLEIKSYIKTNIRSWRYSTSPPCRLCVDALKITIVLEHCFRLYQNRIHKIHWGVLEWVGLP